MKRVALTPDELDLVLEHRRCKRAFNEGVQACIRAVRDIGGTGPEESLVVRAGVIFALSKLECE